MKQLIKLLATALTITVSQSVFAGAGEDCFGVIGGVEVLRGLELAVELR